MEIKLEVEREEITRATQYTLVGKILANKMLNKKRVMRVIRNIWTEKEVVAVKELEGNLYGLFCLNLKKWEVDQAVQDICFSKVCFRIQIHNLPLELMIMQNARKIGEFWGM